MANSTAELSFFSGPELREDPNHAATLLAQLKSFYDSRLLCDVTIEVLGSGGGAEAGAGGRLFACNRNVLAAACPYFRSMFTGGLSESKQQKVTLHDMDAASMALIIEYCYTGRVAVSEANVQRLYAAADMLQLDYLRRVCVDFLVCHMDPANWAGILRLAEAFGDLELNGSALAFASRHFQQLGNGLCELSLAQMQQLLRSDKLDVDSEQRVSAAAVRWIEAHLRERAPVAQELLQCVRWQLFTDKDRPILEALKAKRFVRKHCLAYVQGILELRYGLVPPASSESPVTPRIGMLAKDMVIFFGHLKEPFLCYDPFSGDIYAMPSPLSSLAHSKAFVSSSICISPENDIYLATQPGKQLWVYSPMQNSWQQLADRLLCREGMDLAYLNGHIYILGGCDPSSGAKLKEVECYSIQRNQWTLVAPLKHSFCSFELVTVNNCLYAVNSKRMQCYDPTRNRWLNCSSLKRRDFQQACVFNDEIYCICDVPVVKVYSPARGEWRVICNIPVDENIYNYQIVQHGNKLLLITSTPPQWNKNKVTVYEYEVATDRWVNVGTMLGLLHYDCEFICLSARVYPCCLEPGQSFITDEEDVPSQSTADWAMDGFSELNSESGSSSSFSDDENWHPYSAPLHNLYILGAS
ncbi:kelch repeat and BTB domain-containing protein 7-like [Rhinatrema bivittatum]|uniref:kelch repeat and BTB domain-containing protein 7-like n=1 Tax=Rhinatrema bivittatum TaxID=194408 RepID=UPI00112C52BF|nr:kelch repeat and BTB domain-containing protein 7-like [Rhinatrema bivittatum]